MYHNPQAYGTMPVGIVLRRSPGVTRWAAHHWRVSAVLPGAGPAEWRELRREGDWAEYHAATEMLELHGADTEAYVHGLNAQVPSIYVVLRQEASASPLEVVCVTVSPYEAQDYADSGEEIVERLPMPPGLLAWVRDFVERHHVEETFVKRKRDRRRVDLTEDGKGDVRIAQAADVYRAPTLTRKERLQ